MPKTVQLAVVTVGVLLTCGAGMDAGQLGSVANGAYRHSATGVQFPVLPGWRVLRTGASSDGGDQVYLQDAISPTTYVAVWMKKDETTPAQAEARLNQVTTLKLAQRTRDGAPALEFPGGVQHVTIGGHHAIKATADFMAMRQRGVEYFTWIYTEHTRVQFDVRGVEPEAGLVALRVESLIDGAQIP